MTTKTRKPLLQDLSEQPGHVEGDQLYRITSPDGRKVHKRAHTAREAWVKARLEIGGAEYNECEFSVVKEGAQLLPEVPEVPVNGKAHELSHSAALARIEVLEELVKRKDADRARLGQEVHDLEFELAEYRKKPRRIVLGAQRSKSSSKALDKLIPKKGKRVCIQKKSTAKPAKKKSARRAART